MKLKEIDRTVHVAWSPAKTEEQKSNVNYFVAGTAAQQLDASFRLVGFLIRKLLLQKYLMYLVQIHN
jgi:hypothetical protein